jgi:hypothetical protein
MHQVVQNVGSDRMGAMGAILNSNRLVEAAAKVERGSAKAGANVTANFCKTTFKASLNQPFEDWLVGVV